ncbi:MAG: ATP-binding cassette domain-containing protein [Anaerolineaceae bacterium]|nr:ATP-binding cassette domain-containing protein [Anaerolineaceae bacterium]
MSTLIELRDLKKYFPVNNGLLHAVDGINLKIEQGKTLGIVGESGCGKSTLGRTVLGLHESTSGEVYFDSENIVNCSKSQFKKARREMQMIFQDPYSSLNPRMRVEELIAEPILINGIYKNKNEVFDRVANLMDTVGLAQRLSDAYPHELDGGRRQRIGVARALSLNPRFIVCDEPVSALDVSIQAQILNLLMDLQDELGLTYMFITHDLSVVRHISTDIAVMYLGKCVEICPSKELFKNPLHPYTKALLSAIPVAKAEMRHKKIEVIRGEVSSPVNPKLGCRFAPRCPLATTECTIDDIPLVEITPGHSVACLKV